MKALILNSGTGSRMGEETKTHPKCMTKLTDTDTIISRQLKQLKKCGIREVVITTGYFNKVLEEYCKSLELGLDFIFINNDRFDSTNYIYSMYLARNVLDDAIVLMHGDLVFETKVLSSMLKEKNSCMAVDYTQPLPEKDFKAVVVDQHIQKVGIEFFENAVTAQPLYKLNADDWLIWRDSIDHYCETGNVKCYAENAFNVVSDVCRIYPYDVEGRLCKEIDTVQDWNAVKSYMF